MAAVVRWSQANKAVLVCSGADRLEKNLGSAWNANEGMFEVFIVGYESAAMARCTARPSEQRYARLDARPAAPGAAMSVNVDGQGCHSQGPTTPNSSRPNLLTAAIGDRVYCW